MLKIDFWHHFCLKFGIEKNRRFVIFRVTFWRLLSILGSIRIYRKTAPTKSTVLGPDPPPENFYKFIENYGFFTILGPSIEPEKPSVKSASTPYPPWKVNFIAFLSIIYHRTTFSMIFNFIWSLAYCLSLPFFGAQSNWLLWVFLVLLMLLLSIGAVPASMMSLSNITEPKTKQNRRKRKVPVYRRSSRQFIATWTTMGLIIRDPIDQAQT
jgi:hypothetical protein